MINRLGREPAEIDALIAEGRAKAERKARELAADPEVKAAVPHGGKREQVDNVNLPKDGNAASYIVRRLKRDHPETRLRAAGSGGGAVRLGA